MMLHCQSSLLSLSIPLFTLNLTPTVGIPYLLRLPYKLLIYTQCVPQFIAKICLSHILAQILMWTDNHRCDIYEQGQYEASVKLNSPSHYSVLEDIKQSWEWTQQQLLRTYEYNTLTTICSQVRSNGTDHTHFSLLPPSQCSTRRVANGQLQAVAPYLFSSQTASITVIQCMGFFH